MLLGEGDAPPVSALSEACRAMVLAENDKLGDDSAGRRLGLRRRGVLIELPKPDMLAGVCDVAVVQGFVYLGCHVYLLLMDRGICPRGCCPTETGQPATSVAVIQSTKHLHGYDCLHQAALRTQDCIDRGLETNSFARISL